MSRDYWLGLLTLPALAAGAFLAFRAWGRVLDVASACGFAFELQLSRDIEGVSDYTLRHDIWWERAFGPVFVGGWYREPPRYREPSLRLLNRWIGIGRTGGPCFTAFRKRDLGMTASPTSRRLSKGSTS